MKLKALKVGDRIEMHPATDRWMLGDRYGEVIFVSRHGQRLLKVTFDRSGKTFVVHPRDVLGVVSSDPSVGAE